MKRSPPPLPEAVLLTDADLVDDANITQNIRGTQPTAVDVEIDCFSRTEPPPESSPRRKSALFACVTGLLLVAATGVLFLGRPLVLHALQRLDAESAAGTKAPAMLTAAALSAPASASEPQQAALPDANTNRPTTANLGPNAEPRSKPSAHAKRAKAAVVKLKKPTKPARAQRVKPGAT